MTSSIPALGARARLLGGHLVVRELSGWTPVDKAPLTFPGRRGGYFVVLRFGALVGVGTDPEEEEVVVGRLAALVESPLPEPVHESAEIRLDESATEGVFPDGEIRLRVLDAGRAQVVANVMGKSTALAHYEERVAAVFDRVERLAEQLRDDRGPTSVKDLLREIGDTLLIRTRMVGRVEVREKPEITWDDPELDRLYERLALEYELADRDRALSRKVELISDVAETYLELLDTRKSVRLEWYIIILIAVEIVIIVWEIFGMK